VVAELNQLKDTYRKQNESVIEQIKSLEHSMNVEDRNLHHRCDHLKETTILHKNKLDVHQNNIDELMARMKIAETNIVKLEAETIRQEKDKTDRSLFF
jgi:hypothetical protein